MTVWSGKVDEILSGIHDAELCNDVAGVVRHALAALEVLGRVHLPLDHFEEGAAVKDRDRHLELAPYVLAALAAINQLLTYVAERFPAPPSADHTQSDDDFDLEFDLVDGPTGSGVGLSHRQGPAAAAASPREQAAEALFAFAGMLRSRVIQFGERLSFAVRQNDRWPLLAELDDANHKLTKAVQAVLFGVLGVFAGEVRREEILPAYRSAVHESVGLRAAVADLTYHISRLNAALANATAEAAVPLVVAISDRLARFSGRPEYRTLRAEDKKAIIEFRSALFGMRNRKEGIATTPLKTAVEGFAKFLEAMTAINHREVLVVHDRQRLQDCLNKLAHAGQLALQNPESARTPLSTVVGELASVQGRHPGLDEARRQFLNRPLVAREVTSEIERWRDLVGVALSTVG